ncbi:hypothetical protein MKJ01_05620 [Chryseobacterium sp. SSA4.19]|uniref:hypothetical protein n=1 Tax=Chryseobacterium sp. SSA4.19 TaxID=2919915 RepID=UPI001F4EC7F5|nr:hypothetical protein [Chryseobacterium sp. SSA4.19]MCJ8153239.1 hypothetical protein [Chryseobacterium sp. SSA4.19]
MRTKFIKVKANVCLPKDQGMYMVIFKNNKVGKFNYWNEEAFKESWVEHVEYWLEEVPDREEEMREMLEGILKINTFGDYIENFSQYKLKIEQLLNK